MKYALVNRDSKVVENVVIWDGATAWTSPSNSIPIQLSEDSNVSPGHLYEEESATFIAPSQLIEE